MENITEKAIENAVASAKMEGIHFEDGSIDIIRKFVNKEITHDEFIKIVMQACRRA